MEISRWDYNELKKILQKSSKASNLPAQQSYPNFISLNHELHSIFNGLRIATELDGHERYALMGLKGAEKALFVSEFVKGEPETVPTEIINQELAKAYKIGIYDFPADIHSHPYPRLPRWLTYLQPSVRKILAHWAAFSEGDLYNLVVPDDPVAISFLVDGHRNLAAFRTADTPTLPFSTAVPTQEEFSNYWRERFGHKGERSACRHPINHLTRLLIDPRIINKTIAQTYGLALYQGRINEDLARIYPPNPLRNNPQVACPNNPN